MNPGAAMVPFSSGTLCGAQRRQLFEMALASEANKDQQKLSRVHRHTEGWYFDGSVEQGIY
jgi:hypothetical protein